jgi:hypothetical protein
MDTPEGVAMGRGVIIGFILTIAVSVALCDLETRTTSEWDLAPPNGILNGCELQPESTVLVKSNYCQPSLDGRYKGGVYYILTDKFCEDDVLRGEYNRTLNALLGINLIQLNGMGHADWTEVEAVINNYLEQWPYRWRAEFLEKLYAIRKSPAFSDGMNDVVLEIFLSDFCQPVGYRLLAKHIEAEAEAENGTYWWIRRDDVAVLASRWPEESTHAFRAVEGLELCSESEFYSIAEVQLIAAVGLARGGSGDEASLSVGRVAAAAEEMQREDVRELARKTDRLIEAVGDLTNSEVWNYLEEVFRLNDW